MAERIANRKASLFIFAPQGHFITEALEKSKENVYRFPNVPLTSKAQSRKNTQVDVGHFQQLINESIHKEQYLRDKQSKNIQEFLEKYKDRKLQIRQAFDDKKKAQAKPNVFSKCLKGLTNTLDSYKSAQLHNDSAVSFPKTTKNTQQTFLRPIANEKSFKKLYDEISVRKISIPIKVERDRLEKGKSDVLPKIDRRASVSTPSNLVHAESNPLASMSSKSLVKALHKTGILKDWNKFALVKSLNPRNSLFSRLF